MALALVGCSEAEREDSRDGGFHSTHDGGNAAGDVGADFGRPTEDAGASDAGLTLGCPEFDLEPYRTDDCFCSAEGCQCFENIPYGGATWVEPRDTDMILRTQVIDLFLPPEAASGSTPLVVYAHANGQDHRFGTGSALAQDVALPLLSGDIAFASVEFRHPFVNASDDAPQTDLARAVQFLRCHADTFGLARDRFAAIARSRGTLFIWTAVQDDMADPTSMDPMLRESTRLLGVFGIQAQTSYWGEWIADTFFVAAQRDRIIQRYTAENFGHAVGDVTADDPPIALIYSDPPEELPITIEDCMMGVDCTHLPNFGEELCAAYDTVGIGQRCSSTTPSDGDLYAPALPWLRGLIDSGG
jgi:hypothetical protein